MRIDRMSCLLTLGLWMLSSVVLAQTTDEVNIDGAYVRAVPPGQPNSAAFMKVINNSATDHAMVGGASPVAEAVELHTHIAEGGMMRMRQVEKIDLPAGETVSLQPGGLHVMLIGLKQKLAPDEEISLTLHFEDGSETTLKVPVVKLQMKMKPMNHDQMNHDQMKQSQMNSDQMGH
jgi:periplasmic copper chaperone A